MITRRIQHVYVVKLWIKDANQTLPWLECVVENVSVWHERLGHPSYEALRRTELTTGKPSRCDICAASKITSTPVKKEADDKNSYEPLERVNMDCAGPVKNVTQCGSWNLKSNQVSQKLDRISNHRRILQTQGHKNLSCSQYGLSKPLINSHAGANLRPTSSLISRG